MEADQRENGEYLFNFQFLLEDGVDAQAVASVLSERLGSLEGVAALNVSSAPTRVIDPVSVAAAVGVSVLIVKQSAEAVEALTRLVRAVKNLVAEIRGVSDARLEVSDQVRRLEDLREQDLEYATRAALE